MENVKNTVLTNLTQTLVHVYISNCSFENFHVKHY